MITQSMINDIVLYIQAMHDEHTEGFCKYSCSRIDIGYHISKYESNHWYVHFGGYCIGNLARNVTVTADSPDELFTKVKEQIEYGLKDE